MSKFHSKLKFLLIPVALVLLYFIWHKWPLTTSQKTAETVDQKNGPLNGTYYKESILPEKTDQYLSADYKLWIPGGVQKIRGLIVKVHGCGDQTASTGLEHANDLQWQALAKKHQFALVGARFLMVNAPCEYWALINYGSGKSFFKALHTFAQKSSYPELERVPWVLWGHSGGADWATQLFQQYPERTVAVLGLRGGAFLILGKNPKLTGTPVLFALGAKDTTAINDTQILPREVFHRYRKMGAPWAIAVEANTAHETSDTRLLVLPYLDAILTARLTSQNNKLRPIDVSHGWLGNPVTHEISSVSRYRGDPLEAAWLPNEETARKWREYDLTGKITPTQKLTAPTEVRAIKTKPSEITVTWRYTPDFENGLPSFHIYRNNTLINTVRGQDHGFGDTPEPVNILLEFRDNNADMNSVYSVGVFNALGESVSQTMKPINLK
jgi:predicted esterase